MLQIDPFRMGCPTHGPWATLWPVMLFDVPIADVKADRELHCIQLGCKGESEEVNVFICSLFFK